MKMEKAEQDHSPGAEQGQGGQSRWTLDTTDANPAGLVMGEVRGAKTTGDVTRGAGRREHRLSLQKLPKYLYFKIFLTLNFGRFI